MSIARLIERWWDRLRGHEPARAGASARRSTSASTSGAPEVTGKQSKSAAVASPTDDGELKLVDETKPAKPGKRKPGAAGFDPYSSDAGYRKPHGWDRVDHD